MATFTTNFQPPTTFVPAEFSLVITPAEAAQLIAELTPLMNASAQSPFTLGNPATGIPCTLALFQALKAGAALTATASSTGTGAAPSVVQIALP